MKASATSLIHSSIARLKQSKAAQAAMLAVPMFLTLGMNTAHAALPEQEAPSRGEGSGIVELVQNYGYDIILLVCLLLCACGFLGVSYHSFTTFGEVQTGKKTWGQFGSVVAVGAGLLVLVIWLVTKASEIL